MGRYRRKRNVAMPLSATMLALGTASLFGVGFSSYILQTDLSPRVNEIDASVGGLQSLPIVSIDSKFVSVTLGPNGVMSYNIAVAVDFDLAKTHGYAAASAPLTVKFVLAVTDVANANFPRYNIETPTITWDGATSNRSHETYAVVDVFSLPPVYGSVQTMTISYFVTDSEESPLEGYLNQDLGMNFLAIPLKEGA